MYMRLAATHYVQEALEDATGWRLQALHVRRKRQGGHAYAPTGSISVLQPRRRGILARIFFLPLLRQGFFVRPHDNDVDDVARVQLLGFQLLSSTIFAKPNFLISSFSACDILIAKVMSKAELYCILRE